jgi:hypothetical protein
MELSHRTRQLRECAAAIEAYKACGGIVTKIPERRCADLDGTKRIKGKRVALPKAHYEALRLQRWHEDQEKQRQRLAKNFEAIREQADDDTIDAVHDLTSLYDDKAVTVTGATTKRERSGRKTVIEVGSDAEVEAVALEAPDAVIDESDQYPEPKALKRSRGRKKSRSREPQSYLQLMLNADRSQLSPLDQQILDCIPKVRSFAFSAKRS